VVARGPEVHAVSTPEWLEVDYTYAATADRPEILLTWYNGGNDHRPPQVKEAKTPEWFKGGSIFEGEKGTLVADYGKVELLGERLRGAAWPEKSIPRSIGHHAEWIKACKEGTPTTCDFAYGGALTLTVLLGNVAYRSGQKLTWDGRQGQLVNGGAAERYVRKEYRRGWEI
jgi:hypothetical protein